MDAQETHVGEEATVPWCRNTMERNSWWGFTYPPEKVYSSNDQVALFTRQKGP